MKAIIEFTDHAYDRLLHTIEGITEDELLWRPHTEMNTVGKVMRHAARIALVLLPQVVEGTTSGDWDDDYEKKEHSVPDMIHDIEAGRVRVLAGLRVMNEGDLDAVIPLWGGRHRRAEGVDMLVGELLYHAGQIALIRGAYRRAHGK